VVPIAIDSDSNNSVSDHKCLFLFCFLLCYGVSNPKMVDNMQQIHSVKINNDLANIDFLGSDSEDRSSMSA
jgi:hypothetical protein